MKCMCAQTRPRFILSSEGVFWGMEFEPMLTPRGKSPLPENVPRGGSNLRRCGQRAQALPTELFRPLIMIIIVIALKGAFQDFYSLLTALQTVSNTHAHVARAQSCAMHVQHIDCFSCAACLVLRDVKGQLSY